MFGTKLRSWMEAVRPRKKQHRKDKKTNVLISNASVLSGHGDAVFSREAIKIDNTKSINQRQSHLEHANGGENASRYSAANLSSPESAYSTGYSTDGNSPGAPPDYYINIKPGTRCFPTEFQNNDGNAVLPKRQNVQGDSRNDPQNGTKRPTSPCITLAPCVAESQANRMNMVHEREHRTDGFQGLTDYRDCSNNLVVNRLAEVISAAAVTSPRQRNRIRTNPWVPSVTLSPGSSCIGLQGRQDIQKIGASVTAASSPLSKRYLSPSMISSPVRRQEARRSLSSSSCSSLSANSLRWERSRLHSGSDEEDCTLNEMMGKYDESYIYEKETDILSDSDPTDCDTDIDTGQDGGDEDDPLEREFDFIDNGSYVELDTKNEKNTGHCTYYSFEIQRKTSRRKTTRRSKQSSEKRRTLSSSKKKQKESDRENVHLDGSKSAGATPLSVRRVKHYTVSKLALEDCLKKRSNSISFSHDPIASIDRRDKEADRKYKELIVEAEHILKNMKTSNISPRRLPGPANKRVEMLRSTECTKPELFMKNRLNDEFGNNQYPKLPSSNFNSPRFSPKRNHITNFINNNSPLAVRREIIEPSTPVMRRRIDNFPLVEKSKQQTRNDIRRSPKYKKKINRSKQNLPDSSDSEEEAKYLGCPQSEPVRRKTYSSHGKSVAFNLAQDCVGSGNSLNPFISNLDIQDGNGSVENLRQQILLNTIVNLKRSLEDQSASLKQVYRSSQNMKI